MIHKAYQCFCHFSYFSNELTGAVPLNSETQLCYFNRGEMNLSQTRYVEKRLEFPLLNLLSSEMYSAPSAPVIRPAGRPMTWPSRIQPVTKSSTPAGLPSLKTTRTTLPGRRSLRAVGEEPCSATNIAP